MNLQRLIAEYRKISRRLKRRALLASARQVQAWKRRLATLEQRIRLMGGRDLRRVAFASALAVAAVPQLGHATASALKFTQQDPGIMLFRSNNLSKYAHPAFVDIDADGDLDAFVVSYNETSVKFFQNQGSKTHPKFVDKSFDPANPMYGHYLPYGEYYNSIATGDIDNDGDQDIVVGNYHAWLFKNVGTAQAPSFQVQYGYSDPFYYISNYGYAKPVLGDLDHDGDLDLIIARYDRIDYYKNESSGGNLSFQQQTGTDNPFDGLTYGSGYLYAGLGDLDGDGDLDVLVGSADDSTYYATLWQNVGSATSPRFEDKGRAVGISMSFLPVLVDLDGDNDLDLVSGNWYYELQHWTNIGTASNAKFTQRVSQYNIAYSSQFADVDSDGDIDQYAYNNTLILNRGGGLFTGHFQDQNPFYNFSYKAKAFGDVDGDGDNDFVQIDNPLGFYRKDGAAGQMNFTELTGAANPFNGTTIGNAETGYAKLVDVDGDGDLDLVYIPYGTVRPIQFWLNDGTPTAPHFIDTTGPANPFAALGSFQYSDLMLKDMDGDGDMDFVAAGYSGPGYSSLTRQRRYFRNDTDGPGLPNFTAVTGAEDPFTATAAVYGTPVIVDWDEDGDMDILLFSWDYYTFSLLRNDTPRFTKVDAIAKDKGKIMLGPVPAKAGSDVCVFVDKETDTVEVELFNLALERVQSGLTGVTAANACFKANVAPGLYWARIKSGDRSFMQKIIITAK